MPLTTVIPVTSQRSSPRYDVPRKALLPGTATPLNGHLYQDRSFWRWFMSFVPAMWGVWTALVLITLILSVFKGRLERDEEDQIFLDDSFEHERAEQAQIV